MCLIFIDEDYVPFNSKVELCDKLSEEELDKIYPMKMDACLEEMNEKLPLIPEIPTVEKENPPPYRYPREKFGSLLPKEGGGKKGK